MHLLLSGEGRGGIGVCCNSASHCDYDEFIEGPMTEVIFQLIENSSVMGSNSLDRSKVFFVSEAFLVAKKQTVTSRKKLSLKGKRKAAETKYYFENARSLAVAAKEKSEELGERVLAVLFRDADGTASAGRGEWEDKRNSMSAGFQAENFEFGVAMVPKPKSEAWILCACKSHPYQHCERLESESGNDKSPNSLKKQLSEKIGDTSSEKIIELLLKKDIDVSRLDMPSFNCFKNDLIAAVTSASEISTTKT